MRIPNKFNGYSADNIRLYNDPVTLAAVASQAGGIGAAGAALGTTSAALLPAAAAAAPVAAAATAAPALGILPEAANILPQTLGGAQGVMSGAAQAAVPAVEATTAAIPVEQIAAAGQNLGSASGTPFAPPAVSPSAVPAVPAAPAPGVPSLPNVSTTPPVDQAAASKAYYETAANQASNELNRGIAQKVGEQYDPMTFGFDKAMNYAQKNPMTTASGLYALSKFTDNKPSGGEKSKGSSFRHEDFNASMMNPLIYGANGGIMSSYADGGPVEQMSNMNAIGGNEMYPMANIPRLEYANPVQQRPVSENIMTMGGDSPTDPYTGQLKFAKGGTTDDDNGMSRFRRQLAKQEAEREALGESLYSHARAKVEDRGIVSRPLSESSTDPYTASINRMKKAHQVAGIKMQEMPKLNMPESFSVTEAAGGGIMRGDLGGYSDGGRLLKGPGDGVSDSIPAVIGNKQPARLADGEFVVPARIVSELGNGSTEAGARKLYAMMERIQKGRKKSVGKGKVAVNSKAAKHLPA